MAVLNIHEAAVELAISESELRRLLRRGDVPHERLGTGKRAAYVFDRDELGRWARERDEQYGPTRLALARSRGDRLATQVAEQLGVDAVLVERLRRAGWIKGTRITGDTIAYSREQVARLAGLLAALEVTP